MKYLYLIIGIIIIALGAGWYLSSSKDTAPDTANEQSQSMTQETITAVMSTSMGDITLELNPAKAPKTVENFVKLAKDGFYDGTRFHRVIPDFMIQGGDPLSKDDSMKARWGTGGPGYTFDDEIDASNQNNTGTIAMANAGPNTNGSQFFINVADNNFLDPKHTVFGMVTNGMEVVNQIVNVPTEAPDRPVQDIVINSITIQ